MIVAISFISDLSDASSLVYLDVDTEDHAMILDRIKEDINELPVMEDERSFYRAGLYDSETHDDNLRDRVIEIARRHGARHYDPPTMSLWYRVFKAYRKTLDS